MGFERLSPSDIPEDWPVRPARGENVTTCGTCGLSWDDSIVTEYTPAPSARCPFETFHRSTWDLMIRHRDARSEDLGRLYDATDATTVADILGDMDDDETDFADLGRDAQTFIKGLDALGVDTDDMDADTIVESAREAIDNYGLGVSMVHTIRVEISTGGPAEYLTADVDRGRFGWERESSVTFHYADWGTHDQVTLSNDDPMVTWVDEILESWADEA